MTEADREEFEPMEKFPDKRKLLEATAALSGMTPKEAAIHAAQKGVPYTAEEYFSITDTPLMEVLSHLVVAYCKQGDNLRGRGDYNIEKENDDLGYHAGAEASFLTAQTKVQELARSVQHRHNTISTGPTRRLNGTRGNIPVFRAAEPVR